MRLRGEGSGPVPRVEASEGQSSCRCWTRQEQDASQRVPGTAPTGTRERAVVRNRLGGGPGTRVCKQMPTPKVLTF